jgi:hypothetical protein
MSTRQGPHLAGTRSNACLHAGEFPAHCRLVRFGASSEDTGAGPCAQIENQLKIAIGEEPAVAAVYFSQSSSLQVSLQVT